MDDFGQDSENQKQVKNAYNWLDDHGQLAAEDLMALAEAGTAEALERLHQIADDNNISYDDATDPVQLAEEITRALESDINTGVE